MIDRIYDPYDENSTVKFSKCGRGHTMELNRHSTSWGIKYTLKCRCGSFREFYKDGLLSLMVEWEHENEKYRTRF